MQEQPRRTGFFWLDTIVAVAAIVVSFISLWVALQSNRTQERLLAASVWPSLEFSTGNYQNGKRVITLSLRNAGVGPARVRWMQLYDGGKPQRGSYQLLTACCDRGHGHPLLRTLVTNSVERSVLDQNQSVDFVSVVPSKADAAEYAAFDLTRTQVRMLACYCSVLDECWLLDSDSTGDPSPVHDHCHPPPRITYRDGPSEQRGMTRKLRL